MAETSQITFSHKEVVEALLRKQGIKTGIWGLYVRFGLKATNVGMSEADLNPAAIVPVLEIGLQRFDKESNLAIDAAKINSGSSGRDLRSMRRRK
jgi:hypothetical protein